MPGDDLTLLAADLRISLIKGLDIRLKLTPEYIGHRRIIKLASSMGKST